MKHIASSKSIRTIPHAVWPFRSRELAELDFEEKAAHDAHAAERSRHYASLWLFMSHSRSSILHGRSPSTGHPGKASLALHRFSSWQAGRSYVALRAPWAGDKARKQAVVWYIRSHVSEPKSSFPHNSSHLEKLQPWTTSSTKQRDSPRVSLDCCCIDRCELPLI